MNRICQGAAGLLIFVLASAQAQTAEPAFAVASIKPTKLARYDPIQFKPGGRLTANSVTVGHLVDAAYGGGSTRLQACPKCPNWMQSERFEVEAIAEEGVIPERLNSAELRRRMQPMLQRLLAERFQLVIKREQKEMPVYELTVSKSGAKLTESPISEAECLTSIDCHKVLGTRRNLHGTAVNMADLALALGIWADRPVVDATGIAGLYSVQIKPFANLKLYLDDYLASVPENMRPPPEPYSPSLSSVLEKDFGLLLRPAHARIETIEIESINRPSVN